MAIERVSEILPNQLWISDIVSSQDTTVIRQLGITHIVNASNRAAPNKFTYITYFNVDIEDTENQDISANFEECNKFISRARNSGGHVLVHCMVGVSRSPTLVIHHLMMERLTLLEALEKVKNARPVTQPNKNFIRQLLKEELRLRGRNSLQIKLEGNDKVYMKENGMKHLMNNFGADQWTCWPL